MPGGKGCFLPDRAFVVNFGGGRACISATDGMGSAFWVIDRNENALDLRLVLVTWVLVREPRAKMSSVSFGLIGTSASVAVAPIVIFLEFVLQIVDIPTPTLSGPVKHD